MKTRFLGVLTLAGVSLAACGGFSTNSITPTLSKPSAVANAKSTLSFRIPFGKSSLTAPLNVERRTGSARAPMFVDGNSNGGVYLYFDGTEVMHNVSFAPAPGAADGAPGPSGTTALPDGGNFSYTSTIVYNDGNGSGNGNQPYVQVSATYTASATQHTFGIVQTDGACLYGNSDPSQGPCIAGTNGFVLAEGQQTFVLQPGSNPATTMYLHGVVQSAYMCDLDPSGNALCDGGTGTVNASGVYPIYVVVTTESGDAIPYQLDGSGTPLNFDNGSYRIVELDGQGIVSITNADGSTTNTPSGPYSASGQFRHGLYGQLVGIKCNKSGATSVGVQLTGRNTPLTSVTGFTYDYTQGSGNYPAAGSILGSVGANNYMGGPLPITC